ncbi:MAG: division/cell wall cluster transcriptional repressor MraZ [Deltaproteobacteria bacterium]|nr:division/cell wall cluster transcriptional repressor MraZ [Deltaproteobacteria bacterium]
MADRYFQSEFRTTVDAKRRLSIPAKFREILSESFGDETVFVTRGVDSLCVYPASEWAKICEKFHAAPPDPHKEFLNRFKIAPAAECAFDAQGRIQLPRPLADHAGLEKDVVIVGASEKFEIWSLERHLEQIRKAEEFLRENPGVLTSYGF